MDKEALKVAKEITIKFIEVGKISPSSFNEHFQSIYNTVKETIFVNEINNEIFKEKK